MMPADRGSARRTLVTLLGQWGRFGVQFLAIAALARLLNPADFGQLAIILAVTGAATIIADSGLSLAAMQAKALSTAARDRLLWTNLALGAMCMVAVCAAAPLLGAVYNDRELVPAVLSLSVTFPIGSAAAQYRAGLARDGRAGTIASSEVGGQIAGLGIGVALAYAGTGLMALVGQQIAIAVASLAILMFRARWLPRVGRTDAEQIVRVGRFSIATTLTQFANYLSSNVDSIMLARFSTFAVLGVYSRAYQLSGVPLQQLGAPLTRVALPALSQVFHSSDSDAFERVLAKMQTLVCWVVLGGITIAFVFAPAIVNFALGPQWESAAEILRLLLLGGAAQAVGYTYYWGFLAKAQIGALLLSELPGRAVMVAAIVLAASNDGGANGVAIAHTVGLVLVWAITSTWAARKLVSRTRTLLLPAFRPLCVYGLGATVGLLLARTADGTDSPRGAALATFGLIATTVAALAVPAIRHDLKIVAKFGRDGLRGSG